MLVTAKRMFDRESHPGKRLAIPIRVADRKGLENRKKVYIYIGDENDNPMSDGHMNIVVYSYQGHLKHTVIGYPYVNDKDDWDVGQKIYKWVKSVSGFNLQQDGQLAIDADISEGIYELVVDVIDEARQEKAKSFISVDVRQVPEIAVKNHVGIQILHFCHKMEKFRQPYGSKSKRQMIVLNSLPTCSRMIIMERVRGLA